MGGVIVTDGMQRSTLALTRSLGKKGIDVTVGEHKLPCLTSRSKYCHNAFEYPSPYLYPSEFISSLMTQLQKNSYDLLIPMTDMTCYLVGQNITKLSQYTKISMADWETYKRVTDKGDLIKLCLELDIPVPKTVFIGRIEDLDKSISEFSFPVIIKPRGSIFLGLTGWIKTGVDYAYSKEELIYKLESWDRSIPFPVIQERIIGPGCGAFFLFIGGEEKAAFFHRRIREKPPSGGVSVLRESIPVDPQMREYAVRILKHLNWHGVAMVEFKQDVGDGIPKLMEINARFWGSLQLAIDSGVDFPYILYLVEMNKQIQSMADYQTGIKTRWLMGDFDHLLARFFKKKASLKLPADYPGRLTTLLDFFKFYQRDMNYEILKGDDLFPFFFEVKKWVKDILVKRQND